MSQQEQTSPPCPVPDVVVRDRPTDRGGRRRRRREAEQIRLTAMVERVLDPAVGLYLRAFDRRGERLESSRAEAREVAVSALGRVARRGGSDDDETARRVMCRTAEIALDKMVGSSATVPLPRSFDLETVLGDAPLESVAPDGRINLAELQDAVAACRAADRQIAYVVLAAGIPPEDAGVLLGRSPEEIRTGLRRVGKRLEEAVGLPGGRR